MGIRRSSSTGASDIAAALGREGRDGAARKALLHALRRSARPSLRLILHRLTGRRERVRRAWTITSCAFRRHENREIISLLVDGRPYWWPGLSPDDRRQRCAGAQLEVDVLVVARR